METRWKSWLILLVTLFITIEQTTAKENIMIKQMVQDNSVFALNLYGQLKQRENNLFFSPFSISAALAMTYSGAREKTASQMAAALHFNQKPDQLHHFMGELISRLNAVQKESEVELSVANAIWAQKGYPFLDAFFRIIQQSYQADLNQVDFATAADAARQAINGWVEDQTHQKIKNLIPPGVLDALTRLVLVNAIYFKGFWDTQFKPENTEEMAFWLSAETNVKVPMMHQEHPYGYWENEWLQVLEIPYKDEALSLIVLLPKEKTGISVLEQKLSLENILRWQDQLRKQKIKLFFPKFKIEAQFNLGQTLSAMGMPDAFDPNHADFSAMIGKKELFISAVIHKAFVEVNEEGTEAAAATGVVVGVTSIAPPSPIFKADHPFVFFIRDNASHSILFIGRVLDPSQSG
ncbi:MAG: serpin family protein [Desulfobacterales bacterium]|jgi:serpin B